MNVFARQCYPRANVTTQHGQAVVDTAVISAGPVIASFNHNSSLRGWLSRHTDAHENATNTSGEYEPAFMTTI